MPRREPEMLRVHRVADKIEGTVAARLRRGWEKAGARVSIHELGVAISTGGVEAAMRLFPVKEMREDLSPVATSLEQSFVKGGRIAIDEVKRAGK